MKKWIQLVAMMLAVVMLAGCNLIAVDEEMNAKVTVLTVGDQVITKGELSNAYANAMNSLSYQYQLYGLTFDATSSTAKSSALDSAIDSLVSGYVVQQKGKALGLDQFTDEQLAELEPKVQEEMDYYISLAQAQYFADTTLEGDELTAAIAAKLTELGITREDILENAKMTKIADRVREEAIKDVTIAPEDVDLEYQAKVAAQKESYAGDLSAYATDVMNGTTIYYVPAGYRYVKHVLISVASDASSNISALESELSSLRTTLSNVQTSLNELVPAAAEVTVVADATPAPTEQPLTDEEKASRDESIASLTELLNQTTADIAAKEAALETAKTDAFAAILPQIEEVKAKIELGLNFDKVVENYGQDSGMKSEPAKSMGYPVAAGMTTYDQAFQDAAMALAKVGDVSEPVKSSFGYHIIKYVSDSTEAEVGIDAVREDLTASMLTTKQDTRYNEVLDQWIAETKVKRYDNRMDFM